MIEDLDWEIAFDLNSTVDAPELVICIGDGPFLIFFFRLIFHSFLPKHLRVFFTIFFFQTLNSILNN